MSAGIAEIAFLIQVFRSSSPFGTHNPTRKNPVMLYLVNVKIKAY
jgi:hypothetical protein